MSSQKFAENQTNKKTLALQKKKKKKKKKKNNIRAIMSETEPSDMCAQQRFRSACAFVQADLNLCWAHFG